VAVTLRIYSPAVRVLPAFALVVLVLAAGGCGGDSPSPAAALKQPVVTADPEATTTVVETVTAPDPGKGCHAIGRSDYRYCERLNKGWQVAMTLQVRRGDEWETIAREPAAAFKRHRSHYWGIWSKVKVSPDGKTLLATWSTECENHYAFFIPAAGGKPRLVTGKLDWDSSPNSFGIGWAHDGRARVGVGEGCGGADWTPGTYLIDPRTGESELVG
jgi:hypothetical protein